MSDEQGIPVTLGVRDYRVLPQPIGRIRRHLTAIAPVLEQGSDAGAEGMSEALHRFFKVFIPDIAPAWELLGYASEQVYDDAQKCAREIAEVKAHNREEEAKAAKASLEGKDPYEPQLREEPEPFEEPEDEEAEKRSPTGPQLGKTFEAVFTANGGDRLVRLLKNVVGLDLVQAVLKREAASWARDSRPSASLPSPSGDVPPTTSTPPDLTSASARPVPSPGSGEQPGASPAA